MGNVVNAIKQSSSSRKTVFVWAAGNAHGDPCDPNDFPASHRNLCVNGRVNAVSPAVFAGLPVRFPELRENLIAVVAVDRNGDIASFSARCGKARDSCIAAPGEDIRLAFFGPLRDPMDLTRITRVGARGSFTSKGTSYAAPMVTGGLGCNETLFSKSTLEYRSGQAALCHCEKNWKVRK